MFFHKGYNNTFIISQKNKEDKFQEVFFENNNPFFRGQVLKPSEKNQQEMFCGGLAEILFRVAEGNEAVFCLPGSDNCFEPSAHYGIDGVTEKVMNIFDRYFHFEYSKFWSITIKIN